MTLVKGSTLQPLLARFEDSREEPIDIAGDSIVFSMVDKSGNKKVDAQGALNKQAGDGEVAITSISKADPAVVTTAANHGLSNGDRVLLHSVDGMDQVNDREYVVASKTDTTFELEGENSLAFNTHQANTGIVSTRGFVQYDWAAGDVDTADIYMGQFKRTNGGKSDYAPTGEELRIEIEEPLGE